MFDILFMRVRASQGRSYPLLGLFYLISFIRSLLSLLSLYASSREPAKGAQMIYTKGEISFFFPFFEQVQGWWLQPGGVEEYAPGGRVFASLEGRSTLLPNRVLGTKYI